MTNTIDIYRAAQIVLKNNQDDKNKALEELADRFLSYCLKGERSHIATTYEISLAVLDLTGDIPEEIKH